MNRIFLTLFAAIVVTAAGCSSSSKLPTPTAAFKAYYEAAQKADAAGIKATMSKRGLEMLATIAEQDHTTVDAYLTKTKIDASQPLPEIRNETINGDKGSIEVKGPKTGSWETWQFVKEDGGWKLAFENMFAAPNKPN